MEKMVIKQGEAKTVTFTVKDRLGSGVDLSGAALLLGVKKDKSEAEYTFSKADLEFDKSQAANGIVSVNLRLRTPTSRRRPIESSCLGRSSDQEERGFFAD
jgi:hypothetical protein